MWIKENFDSCYCTSTLEYNLVRVRVRVLTPNDN